MGVLSRRHFVRVGVAVAGVGLLSDWRAHLVQLAARHRLSALYSNREFADSGGLMSYGVNVQDLYRRAATYVDRLVKGAKPDDLPVEQPTEFDFVVNLTTARSLGLTIPQSILQQATEVIR